MLKAKKNSLLKKSSWILSVVNFFWNPVVFQPGFYITPYPFQFDSVIFESFVLRQLPSVDTLLSPKEKTKIHQSVDDNN